MSPAMDAARRGSGPSIAVRPGNDLPEEDGRPWRITCRLCGRISYATTFRAAQNQIDTHQRLHHEAAS